MSRLSGFSKLRLRRIGLTVVRGQRISRLYPLVGQHFSKRSADSKGFSEAIGPLGKPPFRNLMFSCKPHPSQKVSHGRRVVSNSGRLGATRREVAMGKRDAQANSHLSRLAWRKTEVFPPQPCVSLDSADPSQCPRPESMPPSHSLFRTSSVGAKTRLQTARWNVPAPRVYGETSLFTVSHRWLCLPPVAAESGLLPLPCQDFR
jgi:hypothetical protein